LLIVAIQIPLNSFFCGVPAKALMACNTKKGSKNKGI
jgi:hypothetical protein